MNLLLIAILTCFLIGNIYIFIRALYATKKANKWIRIIFSVLYWASALSLFIVLALRRYDIPAYIPKIMFTVGCVWLVFTLYMTLILLIADIARVLLFRKFRYTFICSLTATLVLLTYGYINYLNPKVYRIDIPIEKKFEGDTLTVVGISDLHLGYGTGKSRLKDFVTMINAEQPDVILIAGDLIDNSLEPVYSERMHEELCKLNAPMGIYMCPGNHEYFDGIEKFREFISLTPITLLEDSVATLPNGIQIFGRNFKFFKKEIKHASLKEIKQMVNPEQPIILLDHAPISLKYKDKYGFDLQFSGHTHNGQIWPGNLITASMYEQDHGYRKWPHSHVFVSSGLSLWGPPFRIGTNSDMVVFKIYSTKKQ